MEELSRKLNDLVHHCDTFTFSLEEICRDVDEIEVMLNSSCSSLDSSFIDEYIHNTQQLVLDSSLKYEPQSNDIRKDYDIFSRIVNALSLLEKYGSSDIAIQRWKFRDRFWLNISRCFIISRFISCKLKGIAIIKNLVFQVEANVRISDPNYKIVISGKSVVFDSCWLTMPKLLEWFKKEKVPSLVLGLDSDLSENRIERGCEMLSQLLQQCDDLFYFLAVKRVLYENEAEALFSIALFNEFEPPPNKEITALTSDSRMAINIVLGFLQHLPTTHLRCLAQKLSNLSLCWNRISFQHIQLISIVSSMAIKSIGLPKDDLGADAEDEVDDFIVYDDSSNSILFYGYGINAIWQCCLHHDCLPDDRPSVWLAFGDFFKIRDVADHTLSFLVYSLRMLKNQNIAKSVADVLLVLFFSKALDLKSAQHLLLENIKELKIISTLVEILTTLGSESSPNTDSIRRIFDLLTSMIVLQDNGTIDQSLSLIRDLWMAFKTQSSAVVNTFIAWLSKLLLKCSDTVKDRHIFRFSLEDNEFLDTPIHRYSAVEMSALIDILREIMYSSELLKLDFSGLGLNDCASFVSIVLSLYYTLNQLNFIASNDIIERFSVRCTIKGIDYQGFSLFLNILVHQSIDSSTTRMLVTVFDRLLISNDISTKEPPKCFQMFLNETFKTLSTFAVNEQEKSIQMILLLTDLLVSLRSPDSVFLENYTPNDLELKMFIRYNPSHFSISNGNSNIFYFSLLFTDLLDV